MTWSRIIDFLSMDGHGLYVWGTYAAAFGLALIEIILLALRKRAILGHLGWQAIRARDDMVRSLADTPVVTVGGSAGLAAETSAGENIASQESSRECWR